MVNEDHVKTSLSSCLWGWYLQPLLLLPHVLVFVLGLFAIWSLMDLVLRRESLWLFMNCRFVKLWKWLKDEITWIFYVFFYNIDLAVAINSSAHTFRGLRTNTFLSENLNLSGIGTWPLWFDAGSWMRSGMAIIGPCIDSISTRWYLLSSLIP